MTPMTFQTPPILGLRRKYKKARVDQMGKPVRRLAVKTRKIEEGDPLGSASAPSRTLGEGWV